MNIARKLVRGSSKERGEKRRKRGGGGEGEVGGRRGGRKERWEERRRGSTNGRVLFHGCGHVHASFWYVPCEDHTSNQVFGCHLLEPVLIRRVKLIPAEEREREGEKGEGERKRKGG